MDCLMQMSAEGVGFPAGKTPKGVSCADGDTCDLDGRRNGVCLFSIALCLNEPTRACQPRDVRQTNVKAKKKSGIDVASLQAQLAAIPLPTRATVCTPGTLISVPLPGPNHKGLVKPRHVALKGVAKAGGKTDSDTYKLTCAPTTIAGGGTPTTVIGATTTTSTTIPYRWPARRRSPVTDHGRNDHPGRRRHRHVQLDRRGRYSLVPSTVSTTNPAQARVQFTLAHLDNRCHAKTEGESVSFHALSELHRPDGGSARPRLRRLARHARRCTGNLHLHLRHPAAGWLPGHGDAHGRRSGPTERRQPDAVREPAVRSYPPGARSRRCGRSPPPRSATAATIRSPSTAGGDARSGSASSVTPIRDSIRRAGTRSISSR